MVKSTNKLMQPQAVQKDRTWNFVVRTEKSD